MFNRVSESMLLPDIIKIKDNLIIAKFELMKIIPAKHIIEMAIKENKINPDFPIVETSSGTFALGLGIVCTELKIPFFIISDPVIDESLKSRLIQLGGRVQILSESVIQHNPQEVRLNSLKEYLGSHPSAYWTNQYDNIENQNSYAGFSEYLLNILGKEFTLVGSVGSGGSTCGTIKKIREMYPQIRLVGVDTHGSILFGLANQKRVLRGLGNSIMPKNLIHQYFDEIHWISADNAFFNTKKLFQEKGLFCGPTTGAAYQVASWIAEKNPHELVVFLSADTGNRYQDTIYNHDWLKADKEPVEVNHPSEVKPIWSYIKWKRRSLNEIMK